MDNNQNRRKSGRYIEEGISIIGKPDVAKNPMIGELERIVTDKKTLKEILWK